MCHHNSHVVICRNRCMTSFESTKCYVIYPNPSSLQCLCMTFCPNPISSCICVRVQICDERAIYYVHFDDHILQMIRMSLTKMTSLHHNFERWRRWRRWWRRIFRNCIFTEKLNILMKITLVFNLKLKLQSSSTKSFDEKKYYYIKLTYWYIAHNAKN